MHSSSYHRKTQRHRIRLLETEILKSDAIGFARAAEIWRNGGLVSFPTETVYGLGADARNGNAVARIFEAKQRPSFNPLIVHVDSIETAKSYVDWTDNADRLAQAFWPGPLTLVLPLKPNSGLSALVTAGLSTLAIRVPAHPVAQRLLETFGGPIAAPSANPSGKISATAISHVQAGLGGRIDAILDGGTCSVGLESTIVGLDGTATLLRPGGLPQEALEAALGYPLQSGTDGGLLTSPGQMLSHYAPSSVIRLNAGQRRDQELFLGFGPVDCDRNLSLSGDLTEAAANLFQHLHDLDAMEGDIIAVSTIPDHGLGRAINDRLRRAAAPRP